MNSWLFSCYGDIMAQYHIYLRLRPSGLQGIVGLGVFFMTY